MWAGTAFCRRWEVLPAFFLSLQRAFTVCTDPWKQKLRMLACDPFVGNKLNLVKLDQHKKIFKKSEWKQKQSLLPTYESKLVSWDFVSVLFVSVCLSRATEQNVFPTVCLSQNHLKTTAVGPSSCTFSETSFWVTRVLHRSSLCPHQLFVPLTSSFSNTCWYC